MLNKICGVDVGKNTAFAVFNKNKLLYCDSIKAKNKESFLLLTDGFKKRIQLFKKAFSINQVYIEGVDFRGDSLKSRTAMAKGDLFFLSELVGAYKYICLQEGLKVQVLLAKDWKGNLTKEATKERVKRILFSQDKKMVFNEHEIDAIGICLSQEKNIWNLKNAINVNFTK